MANKKCKKAGRTVAAVGVGVSILAMIVGAILIATGVGGVAGAAMLAVGAVGLVVSVPAAIILHGEVRYTAGRGSVQINQEGVADAANLDAIQENLQEVVNSAEQLNALKAENSALRSEKRRYAVRAENQIALLTEEVAALRRQEGEDSDNDSELEAALSELEAALGSGAEESEDFNSEPGEDSAAAPAPPLASTQGMFAGSAEAGCDEAAATEESAKSPAFNS